MTEVAKIDLTGSAIEDYSNAQFVIMPLSRENTPTMLLFPV